MDDEWKSRWEGAGDREKFVASLILVALPLSVVACELASGASLSEPGILPFGLIGLMLLLRAGSLLGEEPLSPLPLQVNRDCGISVLPSSPNRAIMGLPSLRSGCL
mgnify:CR=1 FL=1